MKYLHFPANVSMQISQLARRSEEFLVKIALKFLNNGRHDTSLKNAKVNRWMCATKSSHSSGLILRLWLQSAIDVISSSFFLLCFSFWNRRNIFPVDWKVFMSRQMEKILLTLNCSSLRELLWQGGAPITRNSSCVQFTKGPKAMFVSNETVATFSVYVMKKLLALCLFSRLLTSKYNIFLKQ